MPQALKPRDFQALSTRCSASQGTRSRTPNQETQGVVSDDEKGSSRQAQPLKTNPNENIRVQGWLPQHDGQEFLLWRAQVNSSPGDRELSTGRQRVDEGYVAVALLVNGILGNFFELRRLAFVTTAGRAGRQAAAAAGVRMLLGQSQVLGVEVQTAT